MSEDVASEPTCNHGALLCWKMLQVNPAHPTKAAGRKGKPVIHVATWDLRHQDVRKNQRALRRLQAECDAAGAPGAVGPPPPPGSGPRRSVRFFCHLFWSGLEYLKRRVCLIKRRSQTKEKPENQNGVQKSASNSWGAANWLGCVCHAPCAT